MSRKPISEKMAKLQADLENLQNRKRQLQKQQSNEERKARTKRLCSRAGLLESMLPETITLTDEQFKSFLEKTVANNFGRDKLKEVTGEKSPSKPADTAGQSNAPPTPQTANTAPNGGTGDRADGGEKRGTDG